MKRFTYLCKPLNEKMKRILIVAVNYNSYEELAGYVRSADCAAEQTPDCSVDFFIADNSSEPQAFDCSRYSHLNVRLDRVDNLGYFGTAFSIVNRLDDLERYAYVMVSNVDIRFHEDTLQELVRFPLPEDVAWLSPCRYFVHHEKYLFTEKKHRIPRSKLWIQLQTYRFPLLKRIQHKITWFRYKRSASSIPDNPIDIYCGCGACFIFTSRFIRHILPVDYPVFLYGEELYMAETVRACGMRVQYAPSVRMDNLGAVSTSSLKFRRYCRYNREALKFILKNRCAQ